eukprot:scaffold19232_cov50-Attheya_sp.AAC.3
MSGGMKQLQGIPLTPDLKKLVQCCLDVETTTMQTNQVRSSSSARTRALAPMSEEEARSTLQQVTNAKDVEDPVLSMNAIRAMKSLILASKDSSKVLSERLEAALSKNGVVLRFGNEVTESMKSEKEQAKFERRLAKLRLRAEETKYKGLTKNLDTTIADDVTTKSMTYAASVGLNMIVAPISFGVFMYFFAGQICSRWIDDVPDEETPSPNNGAVDIRRVIAGVVSGVAMLFIEMTLFVIRSHEFDASIRKKERTNHITPFGYNAKQNIKNFHG